MVPHPHHHPLRRRISGDFSKNRFGVLDQVYLVTPNPLEYMLGYEENKSAIKVARGALISIYLSTGDAEYTNSISAEG